MFKKFLSSLWNGKVVVIICLLVGMLSGFLLAFNFSHNTGIVKFYFKYTEDVNVDMNDIISLDSIEKTKSIEKSYYTNSKINTYAYVDISYITIEKNDDGYLIKVNEDAFKVMNTDGQEAYNDATARGFLKHLVLMSIPNEIIDRYDEEFTYVNDKQQTVRGCTKLFDNSYYEEKSLTNSGILYKDTDNHQYKMMKIDSLIGAVSGLTIGMILVCVLSKKYDIGQEKEYDNKNLYKTPFHISFFRDSIKYLYDVKSLVTISLLLSLVMVSKLLILPSGFGSLGIGLGFIFLGVACMIYGPCPALIIGLISDIVGFLIKPNGEFFFGYTISAMASCLTYAMLLHKTHITFTRVFIARVIVNLIINSILGSVWWGIICSYNLNQIISYMFITEYPKNIAYLIPQSIVLFLVVKAVVPLLRTTKHVNELTTVTLF